MIPVRFRRSLPVIYSPAITSGVMMLWYLNGAVGYQVGEHIVLVILALMAMGWFLVGWVVGAGLIIYGALDLRDRRHVILSGVVVLIFEALFALVATSGHIITV